MSNCTDSKATEVSNIIKADVNFTVLKGDTFDASISFFDSSDRAVNFTGATLVMQIRDDDDQLLATLQSGSGFVISGNTLTFNYITALDSGSYHYDLQCTFANGTKKTLIGGRYKVQREVTTL